MRAIIIKQFGGLDSLVIENLPDPVPQPGSVLIEVRLPVSAGSILQCELVRTEAPIPIIFISGNADIPMSVRAIKEGAVEFLAKPFRDQDLLDAIQHALEIDRAARQERSLVAEVR